MDEVSFHLIDTNYYGFHVKPECKRFTATLSTELQISHHRLRGYVKEPIITTVTIQLMHCLCSCLFYSFVFISKHSPYVPRFITYGIQAHLFCTLIRK